jgi:hypothetical protein
MKITIDVKASVVSLDGVSRHVVFPAEYSVLETLHYDTETSVGLGDSIGDFTIAGLLAASLSLWYAASPTADDVWELIKIKRTEMNSGGIFVAGDWYHNDPETLAQYSIMYAAIAVNSLPESYVFSPMWKTMDGKFRPMTVTLLRGIINIGMIAAAANFTNAERHRALVFASSKPAHYDYSKGWVKVHS